MKPEQISEVPLVSELASSSTYVRRPYGEPRVEGSTLLSVAAHLTGAHVLIAAAAPYLYGPLLAALVVMAFGALLLSQPVFPLNAVCWTMALTSLGLVSVSVGLSNSNTGAWPMSTVFVAEPLLFSLLMVGLARSSRARATLLRWLDLSVVVVSLVGLTILIASRFSVVLPLTFLTGDRFITVALTDGGIVSNYQGFNAVVFLAPYAIVRAIFLARMDQSIRQEGIAYVAMLAVCGALGVVLSARSAFLFTVPFSVVVALLFARSRITPSKSRRTHRARVVVIGMALLLLVTVVSGTSLTQIFRTLVNNATLTDVSQVRPEQASRLTEAWLQSPLLGKGAGATVDGYVRSDTSPWSFELSWHVVLLTTGIVGFIVLAAFFLKAFRLLLAGRNPMSLAMFAALLSTVIASSSNPYLFKLEGMWMVFIPWGFAVWNGKSDIGVLK